MPWLKPLSVVREGQSVREGQRHGDEREECAHENVHQRLSKNEAYTTRNDAHSVTVTAIRMYTYFNTCILFGLELHYVCV